MTLIPGQVKYANEELREENARLRAKLARVVEALENEPDPLEGAVRALAAAKEE